MPAEQPRPACVDLIVFRATFLSLNIPNCATSQLIGWAALLPWCFGGRWPGPSLAVLSLALLISPLVDRALGRHMAFPAGWLRLRIVMATGLGVMTGLIAIL